MSVTLWHWAPLDPVGAAGDDGAVSEPRHHALEAAIRQHRDPASYRVLGDWLEQQGHPRGRLIAVQAALEEAAAAARREELERDQAALFAAIGHATDPAIRYEWRCGFWERVSVDANVELAKLLASPSARFVRDLHLRSTREPGDASAGRIAPGPHVLDEGTLTGLAYLLRTDRDRTTWLDALPAVRELGLGAVELRLDEHTVDGEDGAVLAGMCGLTGLTLVAHHLVPDSVSREAILALTPLAPYLERLELDACSEVDDDACRMIGTFSRLEALTLRYTRRVTPRGLAALAALPRLEELRLPDNYELEDDAVEALAACPALKRLDTSATAISPAGLVRLVRASPSLEELVVDRWPDMAWLDDRGCELLAEGRVPIASLHVRGSRVTLAGLARLEVLPLRRLDLHAATCAGDDAVDVLARFTGLERLVLLRTPMSAPAIVRLASSLPCLQELVVEAARLPPNVALAARILPY